MLHYSKRMFILSGITLGLLVAAPTVADQTKPGQAPKAQAQYTHPGTIRGFNPQPEPPGKTKVVNTQTQRSNYQSPGTTKGFNPQPEPPGSQKGFNPQPEPPPGPR